MNRLGSFVRLDLITVKPYFALKNLLLFVTMAAFLTTMSKNIAIGMSVGMLLGIMFTGYPFAIGDKSNIDALYATLSVDRKTVVLGRYIFALGINAVAILVSVGLGTAGIFALNAYNGTDGTGEVGGAVEIALMLVAVCLLIQLVQLPVYFRFGYTKAKLLAVIPTLAISVSYVGIMRLAETGGSLPEFMMTAFRSGMLIPLAIAAFIFIVFISYRLSLSFYKKREF